tara:strand:+ start:2398 stop:2652 length:255 start_codon:yes stop_codon:yes gene_type:complete
MVFYVYLLKCITPNITKSYVGYTNNISLRLKKHNLGKAAKSTRGYKWKIIFKKKFNSKSLAMAYEYRLKKDKIKRKNLLNKETI